LISPITNVCCFSILAISDCYPDENAIFKEKATVFEEYGFVRMHFKVACDLEI